MVYNKLYFDDLNYKGLNEDSYKEIIKKNENLIYNKEIGDIELENLTKADEKSVKFCNTIISNLKNYSINYNFIKNSEEYEYNTSILNKLNDTEIIKLGKKTNKEKDNDENIKITENEKKENINLDNPNIREKLNPLFVSYEKKFSDIKRKIWWPVNVKYGGKNYYPSTRTERLKDSTVNVLP